MHQVVGEVATADRDFGDEMGQSVTFIDWNCVGHTFTCIDDGTSSATRRKKGKHRLVAHVESLYFKVLEHILDEHFPDLARILRRLGNHELVLFLVDEHIVRHQIVENLLDVIQALAPIDIATFYRVM